MGGKAAAQTILDMRRTGDFSSASAKMWERRWMSLFGHDFYMSTKMAEVIYRWALGAGLGWAGPVCLLLGLRWAVAGAWHTAGGRPWAAAPACA
jgi:hypothetical protein